MGDTQIELVVPTSYCPLDRKHWPGSQLIDFTSDGIKNQGERLAYFVDCERLVFCSSKRPHRGALYHLPEHGDPALVTVVILVKCGAEFF